ncbi:hypothetical protein H634G_01254 [Metarhizium anisopliae BRIP 53293]|uniref:Uncharacterized protein n=1 Tax=Metarhizium anisopliae BRIP 53293 TaxID=1291518 RepID=A0A0D9PE94_METAN|nr:hypothetical protein H634G_01254 [Metarhizium anisopliae BRIP 53293]
MSRSWSRRHAPAGPAAIPPATPQPQPQPQLHQKHHHQPQQPGQQLRRVTSFTQRFRGRKPVSPTAATTTTPQPEAHDAAPASGQLRRRPAYIPTHAAASFARTVSPLSTPRIDERDELACDETSWSPRMMHSTSAARERHVPSTTTTTAASTSPSVASHRAQSDVGEPPLDDDDYAAFLAEAEANDRAFRSRWAQRERERERGQQWALGSPATSPQGCFKGTAQRDSAYYSVASVSPSSMSGHGSGPQKQALHGRRSAPVPLPVSTSMPASTSTPTSPRALHHKPSKTLGRRISEYFKPSSKTGVATVA